MEEIRNKVSESSLIQLDLSKLWQNNRVAVYDIVNDLWQGIALKEKDFRAKLKTIDWTEYSEKYVALHCSEDAIVPTWAYMLISSYLKEVNAKVIFGNEMAANNVFLTDIINDLQGEDYQDGRIIIKGCADLNVDESVYVALMNKLQPIAKSIMFGEPCSTVPLYKRK